MDLFFEHNKYLKNAINQQNCSHQILYGNGIDDGAFGEKYECAICGKTIVNPNKDYLYDRFILYEIGCLTPHYRYVIPYLLARISNLYDDEERIDIVKIFRFLEPEISKYLDETNPSIKFQKHLFKKININREKKL